MLCIACVVYREFVTSCCSTCCFDHWQSSVWLLYHAALGVQLVLIPLGLQPKEGYEMEPPEKLVEAKKRKDAGNDLFKQAK